MGPPRGGNDFLRVHTHIYLRPPDERKNGDAQPGTYGPAATIIAQLPLPYPGTEASIVRTEAATICRTRIRARTRAEPFQRRFRKTRPFSRRRRSFFLAFNGARRREASQMRRAALRPTQMRGLIGRSWPECRDSLRRLRACGGCDGDYGQREGIFRVRTGMNVGQKVT